MFDIRYLALLVRYSAVLIGFSALFAAAIFAYDADTALITAKGPTGPFIISIELIIAHFFCLIIYIVIIPGIGFITRGRGVTVHRRECGKAFNNDPERRVDVTWDSKARVERPVQIRVLTNNSPGILAHVSQTFSALNINISEANCRAGEDGRACNVFTFTVSDLAQLKNVVRALQKVTGVVQVDRV